LTFLHLLLTADLNTQLAVLSSVVVGGAAAGVDVPHWISEGSDNVEVDRLLAGTLSS